MRTKSYGAVFYNCPFDESYKPIFNAVVFCVFATGFEVRCAQESDDNTDIRVKRILKLIGDCRYSIRPVQISI